MVPLNNVTPAHCCESPKSRAKVVSQWLKQEKAAVRSISMPGSSIIMICTFAREIVAQEVARSCTVRKLEKCGTRCSSYGRSNTYLYLLGKVQLDA